MSETDIQKLHKADIAERQIDTAIELFLERKDYLSIITLAGAGEEILGNLLERNKETNMFSHLIDLDIRLSNGGRPYNVVNQEINGFRNSLKHAKLPEEDIIDVTESQEQAIAMLSRVLVNYYAYKKKLSQKMYEFYEWLKVNRPELFPSD